METAFVVLATALALWLVLYGYYWSIIRGALMAKVRLTIVTLESEAIDRLLSAPADRCAELKIVLNRCRRAKRNLDQLTIARVALAEISPEVEAEVKQEELVLLNAPADVRRMQTKLNGYLFFSILVNSPLFSAIGLGLASTIEIFSSFRRAYNAVTGRTWEATVAAGARHNAVACA